MTWAAKRLAKLVSPITRQTVDGAVSPFQLNLQSLEQEGLGEELTGLVGDENAVRLRGALEVRCTVRRLADERFHLAQRYQDVAARDSDTDIEGGLVGGIRDTDGADDGECGPHCPLCIVFMGVRISEQRLDAIAEFVRNEAADLTDRLLAGFVIAFRDVVEILELERAGERRRADDVAEQHRQVSALCRGRAEAFDRLGRERMRRRPCFAEGPAAMTAELGIRKIGLTAMNAFVA